MKIKIEFPLNFSIRLNSFRLYFWNVLWILKSWKSYYKIIFSSLCLHPSFLLSFPSFSFSLSSLSLIRYDCESTNISILTFLYDYKLLATSNLSLSIFGDSFPGGSAVKILTAGAGDVGLVPGSGGPPGVGNATSSSMLAWETPWTEEPGGP